VAPVNNYDSPRLLNYLTAPHVCIWSAAAASCALPGVFDCAELWVKEPNGNIRREYEWSTQGHVIDEKHIAQQYLYTDGSLENDLPMQQLSELFNVNHFIVSQVNFHSALLSAVSLRPNVRLTFIYAYFVGYIHFLKSQIKDWLKNIAVFLGSGANSPSWKKGPVTLLTQSYEGREHDITIMPWVGQISVIQAALSIIKVPSNAQSVCCQW
jgi:TAG lipase/steryl ester hydrolase/phospholipase A2/LPA acyltransferase